MSKAIEIGLEADGITVKIPSILMIDIFKDNFGDSLKLKRKDIVSFMNDFGSAFREKLENDDFMSEVLEEFVFDVDYIEELE